MLIVSDTRRFQPRTIISKPRREQFGLDKRYATAEGPELVYAVASKLSVGELWADSGCLRGVAGSKAHHELKALLAKFGLKPIKEYKTQEFQFGDGKTAVSYMTWVYPVVIQGRYVGYIPLAEVAVPCPALFSKQMLKDWKIVMDFGENKWTSEYLKVSMPFKYDTPVAPIADYGDVRTFSRQGLDIPMKFWIR